MAAAPPPLLTSPEPRVPRSSGAPRSQGPEDVAGCLVEELALAWREGHPLAAADLLAAHPELADNSDVAVRLIYEEVCLRQEAGGGGCSAEVLGRYPRYRRRLEMLLDCHRLLGGGPSFPACGEQLGPFRLLAELGRGACGRVFLATEPALADRVLVLKLTPRLGGEHLSLARLQHAAIVPLYHVQDFPECGLQALCMPYLGGLTLAALLRELGPKPPGSRTGQDVLNLLDRARASSPVPVPSRGVVAREALARAPFADVLCRLAAWLADALQYAHERGLVHLDLKPDNILLAADGQPMLLDFHLARAPIGASDAVPDWVGGTPGYMAPEQEAALDAVRRGVPVPRPVDGRSDLFALGVILLEALTGSPVVPARPARALRRNPQVSPGLAAIVAHCLEADAARRYPNAAALAADLCRHLANQPLQGVPDRNPLERWRKWRRRSPNALSLFGLTLAAVLACAAGGWFGLAALAQRRDEAGADLAEGRRLLREHQYDEAARVCARGLGRLRQVPWPGDLPGQLERELRRAERGGAADRLHRAAEKLRFAYGVEAVPETELAGLAAEAREVWGERGRLTDREGAALDDRLEDRIRGDLLDLAILWTDLRVRRLAPVELGEERRAALDTLKEAERLCGPSPILDRERHALAPEEGHGARRPPRTAWEHYAVGRSLLGEGRLQEAAAAFAAALDLRPGDFWSRFYLGLCCHRLRRDAEARTHFTVCVALAPASAECYYNRALAQASLGQPEQAVKDYGRALELNPSLADAALNRGVLHYQARRYPEAEADLERALRLGADPVRGHFALALARLARDDRAGAARHLDDVLRLQPQHAEAQKLSAALRCRDQASPKRLNDPPTRGPR